MPRVSLYLAVVLTMLLAVVACSKPTASAAPDSVAPEVHVTSGNHSTDASYMLTGVAFDSVGTTSVSWSLNGSAVQPAELSGNSFTASLTLTAGDNEIRVTARDAAGNEGSGVRQVRFAPTPAAGNVAPDAAMPGSPVSFSGMGLGAGGTVTLGGITATTTSWSDTMVVFTVPADAPVGEQALKVTGTFGSVSSTLFVGYDFPVGTIADLAALQLPAGTAVRLAATTYTGGPAGTVVLNNLSLFGQGRGTTTVALGADVTLDYRADADRVLQIQDLTLSVGHALIGPNPLPFPGSGLAAGLLSTDDGLKSQAAGPGSVTFRNVYWTESGVPLSVINTDTPAGRYQGNMAFLDSELELPATALYFDLLGSLSLSDTTVTARRFGAGLVFGHLNLTDVTVTAHNSMRFQGNSGFQIVDSELTSTTGYLDLYHETPAPAGQFGGTSTVIRNSQFSAAAEMYWTFGSRTSLLLEDSQLNAHDFVELLLSEQSVSNIMRTHFTSDTSNFRLNFSPDSVAVLSDNHVTVGTNVYMQAYPASDITFSGNQVKSNTDFKISNDRAEFTVTGNNIELANLHPGNAVFTGDDSLSVFRITDNTFTWLNGAGGTELRKGGNFSLTGNIFNGFGSTGTALSLLQETADPAAQVNVTDNRFSDFQNALHIELGGGMAQNYVAQINDNVFDFPMLAMPQVAYVQNAHMGIATLNAERNTWHNLTAVSEVTVLIEYLGSSAELTVDPVTPAP